MTVFVWIEVNEHDTLTTFISSPETRDDLCDFLKMIRLAEAKREMVRMVGTIEDFEHPMDAKKPVLLENFLTPMDLEKFLKVVVDEKEYDKDTRKKQRERLRKHVSRVRKLVSFWKLSKKKNYRQTADNCVELMLKAGAYGDGMRFMQ